MSLEFKFLVGPEAVEADKQLPAGQRVQWPVDSLVAYAVEDGKIVGRIGAVAIKVVEGTWCAPEKRGTTLPMRLMRQFEAMYSTFLGTAIGAFAPDAKPEISKYLERIGYEKLPVTFYTKTIVEQEKAA
jgi:hypothetical protein